MVLQTAQPENFLDITGYGVANITSQRRSGWFRKIKNDSAKAKWLSDSNWRFFTVDFEDRVVYYSNRESTTKAVSSPISFRDLVEVKLLDRKLQRGLTERLFSAGEETHAGLILITCDRQMRLLCKNLDDAKKWISIFDAARTLGQGGPSVEQPKDLSERSQSNTSTEPGSDESPPQLSDTDSGQSGIKQEPVFQQECKPRSLKQCLEADKLPMDRLADLLGNFTSTEMPSDVPTELPTWQTPAPSWLTPTPEPGSKPETFFEPDGEDAFAALEALQAELGPMPATSEAPRVDTATAIKEAKARRAEKKKEGKALKDGHASKEFHKSAEEKPEARVVHKEMSVEDRNAHDVALLQKVQPPRPAHRSSKARETDETPPLKQTRPLSDCENERRRSSKARETDETPPLKQTWPLKNGSRPGKNKKDVAKGNSWFGDAEEVQFEKGKGFVDGNSWFGDAEEVQFEKGNAVAIATQGVDNKPWDRKSDETAGVASIITQVFMADPAIEDGYPWDDNKMERKAPKNFCGPSEGTIDQSSWDDDEGMQELRSKSLKQKQEVDADDDPTAGLWRNYVYVNGFQCSQCDSKVIRFTGFEWGPKAEYLYFRNHYGKPHKLKSRLNVNDDCSAYCCQCNFKSVPSGLELRDVKDGTQWKIIG